MKTTNDIIGELRLAATSDPAPAGLSGLLTEAADRLDNLFASGIHTCHADCQRPMCVLRRERDKAHADLARVTAERDSQRADIERLVWNLGGCDTIASGWGKPGDYNKEMALPALGSVSRMASERDALRARVAELEAAASLHWITEEELKQARLARDNAKTCEAIHFGAVRWLERYVKVLKIELHRQELANLRKKRTIRGLRKERSKMRALVKEACEGQAAKINALEALP